MSPEYYAGTKDTGYKNKLRLMGERISRYSVICTKVILVCIECYRVIKEGSNKLSPRWSKAVELYSQSVKLLYLPKYSLMAQGKIRQTLERNTLLKDSCTGQYL